MLLLLGLTYMDLLRLRIGAVLVQIDVSLLFVVVYVLVVLVVLDVRAVITNSVVCGSFAIFWRCFLHGSIVVVHVVWSVYKVVVLFVCC